MDTKTSFPVLQPVAHVSKTATVRQTESTCRMPLILLLWIIGVISGCDRKIPQPGEPIIESQKNAAPEDRTRSQDDDPGADR